MPTLCEECDNVHEQSRKLSPRQWLCVAHKRTEGGNFVAPTVWAKREPYLRCIDVNGGACELWKQRREGKERDDGETA